MRNHITRLEGRGLNSYNTKYVAICSCGWVGSLRESPGIAEEDAISHEWAKMFLDNWNRSVELWDDGELFKPRNETHALAMHMQDYSMEQQEYARICCTWIIPSGMVEPHCVAEGL